MIAQLILCFSIIVVLHELGHFLPAKWFKTKVEKFYLFFNPGFSLFKKQIGETEYGIGWLPLGGYVKISGMIDESMDKEQMKREPQPWEFRSKPAWQRLIIMIGGVVVNFILGSFILGMMLWYYGEEFLPTSELKDGIYVSQTGESLGFKTGDRILEINGELQKYFDIGNIVQGLLFSEKPEVLVERAGTKLTLTFEDKDLAPLTKPDQFIVPNIPFIVENIMEADSFPIHQLDIQSGDRIIAINDIPTPSFYDFRKLIKDFTKQEIVLSWTRNGDTLSGATTMGTTPILGVGVKSLGEYFDFETVTYPIGKAIPMGVDRAVDVIVSQVQGFKLLFSGVGDVKESLMGPIGITKLFGDEWVWSRFWRLTAFLSLIVGFVNLLPIPGLDGGYVLITLIEMLTGYKMSDKMMERVVTFGFIILMSLFVLVTCNDISRLFVG